MAEDRRLAAIMFTDIVGYTALMGKDESKAFQILEKNRQIQKPIIKKYQGEWLKEMGDGILASFPTSSDAVRCAGEIQHACKREAIALRIGIHQGEVVFKEGDVLGDGVNVASRLQEIAEEGCINVSGAIYKDIKNKSGITAEFLEERSLKNVEEPVRVYKVHCDNLEEAMQEIERISAKKNRLIYYLMAGLAAIILLVVLWWFLPTEEKSPPKAEDFSDMEISIAVKPFDNFSGDPELEAMCDGLTDAIIHHLTSVKDFDKVISRSSSMVFKESDKTIPEIADHLNVNFILEGSYSESGDRIRIIAQLILAEEDKHIWSEIYDRPKGDIFDIQSDIAQNVANTLESILTPEEVETIIRKPTENLEAYDLYLKGMYYYNFHSEFFKSIEYFKKAIELDASFALAYTGIAQSYQFLVRYSMIPHDIGTAKAKEAVLKALELDPSLGEAHAALGLIMAIVDWNIDGAEEVLKRAIELSPGSAIVYSSYAQYLRWLRRYDEAISMAQKTLELDPLDPMTHLWLGNFYTYAGQYDNCIIQVEKAIELDSTWVVAYNWLAINYALMGNYKKANLAADKIVDSPLFESIRLLIISHCGWAYAKSGNSEKAREFLDILFLISDNEEVDLVHMAIIYAGLGEDEEALKWLEKAVDEHAGQTIYLNGYRDIFFQELANDPRYIELLRRIGFEVD
jgi:TolB-like protein/class 3 adenylate cyclase/Tfp pilus assembly protein PilF